MDWTAGQGVSTLNASAGKPLSHCFMYRPDVPIQTGEINKVDQPIPIFG